MAAVRGWKLEALAAAGVSLHADHNCTARGQDAAGLAFGEWRQTQPPRVEQQLAGLAAKGVTVYALADDLAARGVVNTDLLPGVETLHLPALAALLSRYDRVWHW